MSALQLSRSWSTSSSPLRIFQLQHTLKPLRRQIKVLAKTVSGIISTRFQAGEKEEKEEKVSVLYNGPGKNKARVIRYVYKSDVSLSPFCVLLTTVY